MSRTDDVGTPRTDETLERFSRLVLREQPMPALLRQLVELTASVMPPGTETAVSLRVRGVLTGEATAEVARRLDEAQFSDGGGPGVLAARTGAITEVADLRTEERWPDHRIRAAEAGVLSTLSVPLTVDAEVVGAMTVYAFRADAFDDPARRVAVRLAPHARAAVAGVQDRHRAREMADELEAELETRALIGRAKGILVERYQVTPERAFQLMAQMSSRSRRGLRDVAVGVVRREGDRPG
jgi:GAF domain-containing protein